jgi:hypothetical protein
MPTTPSYEDIVLRVKQKVFFYFSIKMGFATFMNLSA